MSHTKYALLSMWATQWEHKVIQMNVITRLAGRDDFVSWICFIFHIKFNHVRFPGTQSYWWCSHDEVMACTRFPDYLSFVQTYIPITEASNVDLINMLCCQSGRAVEQIIHESTI